MFLTPHSRDGNGCCPLLFALDCDFSIEILEKLIDLGCDINSIDENGDTLLHYAINLENEPVETWLLEKY